MIKDTTHTKRRK